MQVNDQNNMRIIVTIILVLINLFIWNQIVVIIISLYIW